MNDPAVTLCTTDELVDHYASTSSLPRELLQVAIPAGIDAVYANRDADGNMHSAGAAAAVAALKAARA